MIQKNQLVPASDLARKLGKLAPQLRAIHDAIGDAGLSEEYSRMTEALRGLSEVITGLDSKARELFVALRRGEVESP